LTGLPRYIPALYRSLADARVRAAFFNKEVLLAAQRFSSYVWYRSHVVKLLVVKNLQALAER